MIVAQAPAIPYVWDDSVSVCVKDVNGVDERLLRRAGLAFTSLK